MPLRFCAGRGWRGPRAIIFIGGVGQLSAGILAERRRAHETMFRRRRRKKGVRRGSGVPYRHSHFGVPPCANVRCCSPHGVGVSAVSRHHAALCAVVIIVPSMETTVVGARTLNRRAILPRIRVLLQRKHVSSARRGQHGPQLLDFSHILRLTIRAKESGRCLGLKSSSCEMTWRRRTLPVAPCRLALILAFLLFTAVKVRGQAFGCRCQGPTGKWGSACQLN
jgi:hypothetical protein